MQADHISEWVPVVWFGLLEMLGVRFCSLEYVHFPARTQNCAVLSVARWRQGVSAEHSRVTKETTSRCADGLGPDVATEDVVAVPSLEARQAGALTCLFLCCLPSGILPLSIFAMRHGK